MTHEIDSPQFNSDDVKISKAIDQGIIKIGLTELQISEVIERKPYEFDIYETETDYEGVCITWVVNGSRRSMNLMRTYTLKFKNGNLMSWSWENYS